MHLRLNHFNTHAGSLSFVHQCREFFHYSYMFPSFHLHLQACVLYTHFDTVFHLSCSRFVTEINEMRVTAWKSLCRQADLKFDTWCHVKRFWRHREYTSELIVSALFSLRNRLLHSDFHAGRCAGECDGVSPRSESTQGDWPGARHSLDRGLHR